MNACPKASDGVVLFHRGNWFYDGRPVPLRECIVPEKLELRDPLPSSGAEITVQRESGAKYQRTCKAVAPCGGKEAVDTTVTNNGWLARVSTALFSDTAFLVLSSRSAGWVESVVSFSPGKTDTLDVTAVLKGSPSGNIEDVRLCPISTSGACGERPGLIEWNGKVGLLETGRIAPGTYRLVEGDGTSEAWIRVVPPASLDAIREAFSAARQRLEALTNADLPEALASAAGRRGLLRVLLKTAGQE